MREQRLSITRALIQTIHSRRDGDQKSSSQVAVVPNGGMSIAEPNSSNITASKSMVETSSIEGMNQLVERIKAANIDQAGESGDIGSGDGQLTLSKRLAEDITKFQSAFTNNLEDIRKREDLVL